MSQRWNYSSLTPVNDGNKLNERKVVIENVINQLNMRMEENRFVYFVFSSSKIRRFLRVKITENTLSSHDALGYDKMWLTWKYPSLSLHFVTAYNFNQFNIIAS